MKFLWLLHEYASELEAICSFFSVVVGSITIWVLIRTRKAAQNAADAAQEQALAARAQVAAAKAATELSVLQLRPLLVFFWRLDEYKHATLRNESPTGFASNIRVTHETNGITEDLTVEVNVLWPRCEAILTNVTQSKFQFGIYAATYDSIDGRHFVTQAELRQGSWIFYQTSYEVFD